MQGPHFSFQKVKFVSGLSPAARGGAAGELRSHTAAFPKDNALACIPFFHRLSERWR